MKHGLIGKFLVQKIKIKNYLNKELKRLKK